MWFVWNSLVDRHCVQLLIYNFKLPWLEGSSHTHYIMKDFINLASRILIAFLAAVYPGLLTVVEAGNCQNWAVLRSWCPLID